MPNATIGPGAPAELTTLPVSKLLIDEPPLQVLPSLACLLGLNEALVLQQLHYWTRLSPHQRRGADGQLHRWVFNTFSDWQLQFPWWSQRTVQRTFEALVGRGLILVEQFGKDRGDRTNWYALDYACLAGLAPEDIASPPNQPSLFDEPATPPSRQNDEMPITTKWNAHHDKVE